MALLASFVLTGYVVVHIVAEPDLSRMLLWFAAAVIGHDLILFPMYTLADHAARHLLPRRRLPMLNYLRVPALASGLLLLVFLPGIIRQGADTYLAATGQTQEPFLYRWLLLTAIFFTASAIVYALRHLNPR
ncbi:hypothetical protein [Kibdelosporangium phytohabitans]|uniref:hypothetical protein n=1 Tax=Kibdelosporangium phytohabitans TaxID=860235 RepID=UPI0019FFFDE6|nr:hypothetical protein [Kibdelosporangium phytohabitans]MBE1467408.1 hypothetical protein [Kibdelosporangium phytohabitans]